jgi:hypothetical protein
MWYFQFYVTPKPEAPEYGINGGAYVNCWINIADKKIAESNARNEISRQQWKIENLEEYAEVTLDYYSENPVGRKNYQLAVEHGSNYVYHTFPQEKSKLN